MPTLAQLYEEEDVKALTFVVRVAGIVLADVRDIHWGFRFGEVPTCSFTIPAPCPSYVTFNAPVDLAVGFNGQVVGQFVGKVDTPSVDEGGVTVECVGESWRLEVTYARTIPVSLVGAVGMLIENLFLAAGLTNYLIDLPAWSVGSVKPQTLQFQTYSEAVMKLLQVDGSPWYELPSGQVRAERRDPVPASTAWRQYFSGHLTAGVETQPTGITNAAARPRIIKASIKSLLREVRNRITIRSAQVETILPSGETSSDMLETVAYGPSPWITTPPGYNDFSLQNDLIDTVDKAAEVCARYFGLLNRLPQEVKLTIMGDPEVFLGATVQVEDPDYSAVTGRWLVYGYESSITDKGFTTKLDLRGGPGAGTTPLMPPRADFTWLIDSTLKFNQVVPVGIAGGLHAIAIRFDGSSSRDFDGTIVTYAWSDTQGNSGTGPFFTAIYDSTLSSVDVTLTVTDNDGLSASLTRTVNIPDSSAEPQVMGHIYCAAKTYAMASKDGGETWVDKSQVDLGGLGGGEIISVAAAAWPATGLTFAAWGTTSGYLIVTSDSLATVGAGLFGHTSPINSIVIAPLGQLSGGDAFIIMGLEDGLSIAWWFGPNDPIPYEFYFWPPFLDGIAVKKLVALSRLPSGEPRVGVTPVMYRLGGDTADPSSLIMPVVFSVQVDETFGYPGAIFGRAAPFTRPVTIDGALLTAIQAAGAGHHLIGCSLFRENGDADQPIALLFDTGVNPRAWYSPSMQSPVWQPAIGLPPGENGKSMAPNQDGLGVLVILEDLMAYYAADGINYVAQGAAPSQINDIIHEIKLDDVFLGAADGGIVKTVDHGAAIGYIRPHAGFGTTWPGTAIGKQVAIVGAVIPRPDANLYAILGITAAPDEYRRLLINNLWGTKNGPPPESSKNLRYFSGGFMVHAENSAAGNGFQVSTDYGETWIATAKPGAPWRPVDADFSPSGRLWMLYLSPGTAPGLARIYWSDDFGATITLSKEQSQFQVGGAGGGCVAAHPSDVNRIAVCYVQLANAIQIVVTTDGGLNWTPHAGGGVSGLQPRMVWVGSRLVVSVDWGSLVIEVSEDDGATWATTFSKVTTAVSSLQNELVRGGMAGPLFAGLADGALSTLARSMDQGDSWVEVGAFPTGLLTINSVVYDIFSDTLFLTFDSSVEVRRLRNASSDSWATLAASAWESLTDVGVVTAVGDRSLAVMGDAP